MADYRHELTDREYFKLRELDNDTYFWFGSRERFTEGVSDIFSYEPYQEEHHLLTWETEDEMVWIDWDEMVRFRMKNDIGRLLTQDGIRISAQIGDHFSAYMDAYRYLQQFREGFGEMAPEYKGGYLATNREFENAPFQAFDYSHAYLQYSGLAGNFQLSAQPIRWGNSPNSLILSNASPGFAYLGWDRQFGTSHFSFIHGWLLPSDIDRNPETGQRVLAQKYLVGHRWEFALFNRFNVAFTELLIYGNRNPDLIYLVPPVFLWPTQHNLQDRDNLLLSTEFEYFPADRVKLYGTFFLDELSTSEVFSDWWGNKFGLQGGLHVTPAMLPVPWDVSVEFTAVRPWTYTHKYPVNTYTHNGVGMGFYGGPNSQLWFGRTRWWLGPRSRVSLEVRQLKRGTAPLPAGEPGYYPVGNDPDQNYNDRNRALDDATPWLLGEVVTYRDVSVFWEYDLSNILGLRLGYEVADRAGTWDRFVSVQVRFDY